MSGVCLIISRNSIDSKIGMYLYPLMSLKSWRVNWNRIFLCHILDSYQAEALRVLRVHGSKSNIIKKKNQVQIISLDIGQNCVIHCTAQCMAQYDHIFGYSMLRILNIKSLFSKCDMIHLFVKMDLSWCIYLCWYQFSFITKIWPTQ